MGKLVLMGCSQGGFVATCAAAEQAVYVRGLIAFYPAFGLMDEGKAIREAVAASLEAGVTTEDLGGTYATSAVGDWIASKI